MPLQRRRRQNRENHPTRLRHLRRTRSLERVRSREDPISFHSSYRNTTEDLGRRNSAGGDASLLSDDNIHDYEFSEFEEFGLAPMDSIESSKVPSLRRFRSGNNFQDDTITAGSYYGARGSRNFGDSKRFIFVLGAILGILVPFIFGGYHVHKNNRELFDNVVNFEVFKDYFEDWKEIIPESVTTFLSDVQRGNILRSSQIPDMSESFAVGKQLLKEMNITSKHPVILVPGVTSTGIESWGVVGDKECPSAPHFRKRLWGSYYMLKMMIMDKACWLKHVYLDPETGLDPPNFTLRAAQGFEASDYFMAGYWLWNKIIQNLGTIGYDPDTMITASYDWRLSYLDLEKRDRFFSKLKHQIELFHDLTGEKVCLVGHSMGSEVVFYFMKWVEAEGKHYGNGGPQWVEEHIDTFINIAGTLLGAPKAVPALISGEMKDTIQLNALAMYGLEKFFSRKERLEMLQTWGGIPSMLPKGGNMIWGNMNFSPEDSQHNNTDTFGNFIRFEKVLSETYRKNLTMEDSIELVKRLSPEWLRRRIDEQYTYGYATTEDEMRENAKHHSHWTNPLDVALPYAPSMKIYTIYGVHKPTERAYVYREHTMNNSSSGVSLNLTIDYESETPVFFSDGDGTVPIMAHAICYRWAQGVSPYNPAGINVTIVEIEDQPDRFDIRGGAKTADHVDILGSAELNEYILRIAGGHGDTVKQRIITNMTEWVSEIKFPM